MVRIRAWWRALRNVAIAISVIFNIIFIFVLIFLVLMIFDLKRTLIQDLVFGLDKSFYGLNESTILATVKVNDTVPVKLNIPFSSNTTVKLTSNVPLRANATFNLPGGGGTINGAVSIVLPIGLELPVSLNINVPVDDKLPVSLNVPVDIKIKDTQLSLPVQGLRKTLERYVLLLDNLPNSWGEFWPFIAKVASGQPVNLLAETNRHQNPWPDFQVAVSTPIPPIALTPSALPPGSNPPPSTASPLPAGPENSGGTLQPGVPPITATPIGPQPTPTRVDDLGIVK